MPLFVSSEEFERCSQNPSLLAEKADAFIRELYQQLETVKAESDAAAITAEQACSLLEHKYVSLSSEFTSLQSQHSQLNSTLDHRLSELAQLQSEKHQIHLQAIAKDGDFERLSTEVSELHKSKRQLMELLEQKHFEISEKNATIKSYLDKIVNLTDTAASREGRLSEIEAEMARSRASYARISQEKELIERHNDWLNEELTAKVNNLIDLRKTFSEHEAEMSAKLADAEKRVTETSNSLKWNKDRVSELELKLTSLQEDFCLSKEAAAGAEQRFSSEISTVNKLSELYKESSDEWSKKAGELEGVIRALETHLVQVENDYKDRLEKEASARREIEKEAAVLKEKLKKCEEELENTRKAHELNPVPLSSFTAEIGVNSLEANDMDADNRMLVPAIPVGVSGTALAASLLRDGWSLAKMYAKYQEAVDALRHEQLGRKQSQAILERVLYEIEEKAGVILDERAEHEKLVEAYSAVNQKLQHALSEQAAVERTIQDYKADLRRHERDYNIAQKEIIDLQKEVTVLLKECRDIQLRCGSVVHDHADVEIANAITLGPEFDANLSFKDINGLVEQNVQLRSLVRNLSVQIEDREIELKETFEKELQKHINEAAMRVDAVLARAEEQGRMIESLHTSVAMYKKLYEEEQKLRSSCPLPQEDTSGSKDIMHLLEGSQEASKKAREKAFERVKHLEEELVNLRSENSSLRSERDKLTLQTSFAQEKLDRFMKELEHQRDETNGVIARNVEFSQLIIDYQRKMRESSESLVAAEELSRKSAMEVSVLKHEKEILLSSEKRASDEVRCMSERVHRLQASLDTMHSAEEVREEARCVERRKLEDYVKQIEKEWAEAKKELQEERNNVRTLTIDRETTMRNSMRQVEEMGKELANSLHALAAAESRAAVAEARHADLEKKVRSSEIKVVEKDSASGRSCSSIQEDVVDLHSAREEIEKLREEAQVNRDHMLQYKSIAQVNETALKQMETAHENFKIEADKVKKSLEQELLSLKQRVSELENECILKTKEAASAAAGQEEALLSALSEIAGLKDEIAVKLSHTAVMETQLSALKDDLEKEHERWRAAHANYERQVILQSETIQELTKTSQALASLQEEESESRGLADMLKTENNELKAKWEAERSMLDGSKKKAENNYNELNEQNKILHSRVEALHIKLAEKERGSSGMASVSTGQDPVNDGGLQNVVNYLRRSKEIAETEISLLKQEKLRLQSQLESALKAAETAQSSLHAERANSRALMFTEEDFKSLQLQVREMNLLRESNMQLREENRHNFEECQKLRESCQKAKIDMENLESLLRERQNEVEACRKEIEVQKIEKEDLKRRVDELLEGYHNIDVQDYDHMKEDVYLMKENLTQKDAAIEEIKKLLSEKQDSISQFEKDLTSSRMELNERETRINEMLQVEASLRSDVEKQKRFIAQLKKRSENLSKEKEEINKENQALSKQLEDAKQGKRSTGDAIGEQAMKEKEKEKDTRIQILEKTVERQREELRKERDEHRTEKTKRLKTQKTIIDSYETVNQEKIKLENEFEKHKHGLKMLLEEVEKLKHGKSSLPEGTSDVQILSGSILDDLAAGYFLAVESFEQVSRPILSEMDAPLADTSSCIEPSSLSATVGQAASSILPSVVPLSNASPAKTLDERERRYPLPKTNTEIRKATRKLVRPRIGKPEESQGDIEMPDIEGGKALFHNAEVQENIAGLPQSLVRKRPSAASMSDLQDESAVPQETVSDVAAPVPKKSKGSDSPIDGADGQPVPPTEAHEIPSATREFVDDIGDSLQDLKEEVVGAEKNEVEAASVLSDMPKGDHSDMPKGDHKSEIEMQGDRNDVGDEILDKQSEAVGLDDQGKAEEAQDILQPNSESGSEREEGELAPDVGDLEGGINVPNTTGSPETGEMHSDGAGGPVGSSGVDEEPIDSSTMDIGETSTVHILDDEKTNEGDMMEDIPDASDKLDDNNNQIAVDTNQVPDAGKNNGEIASTITVEVGVSKQGSPSVTVDAEPKQVSPISKTSTTINLNERARQRAVLRQAGLVPSPTRGRGRASRIRGGRVGRGGRGQTSGDQS